MTLYAKWENESAVIITPVIPEETPPITPDAIVLISCFIVLMVILLVLSRKTVTYIAYGKEYLKVKVKKNSKFIPPVNPSTENLTFEGWYKDINLTEKLDFEKAQNYIDIDDMKLGEVEESDFANYELFMKTLLAEFYVNPRTSIMQTRLL